jgi:hypothetical protein
VLEAAQIEPGRRRRRARRRPRLTDGDTMSVATRTDTQSPALHVADSHDLIRAQGTREQPDNISQCARCPSLFTGVRGM